MFPEESQPEETPTVRISSRKRLEADKLLNDIKGISCLSGAFSDVCLSSTSVVASLDQVIAKFALWAASLTENSVNLLDFSKTCEALLQPERYRKNIYEYRVKYLNSSSLADELPKDVSEKSPDLHSRMESNRLKALAIRRQRNL